MYEEIQRTRAPLTPASTLLHKSAYLARGWRARTNGWAFWLEAAMKAPMRWRTDAHLNVLVIER